MKVKVFALVAMLFAGIMTASAQTVGGFASTMTDSGHGAGVLRFGVTVGMNLSNISDTEMDSRIGFNVGVRAEYNFSESVYGNVGLLFTQKGCEFSEDGDELKYNPGYLELPIHVGYRYSLGNNVSIFGETGPYFAVGVCGKTKVEYQGYSGDADFFGDGGAKRFDAGWGLRTGVEFSKFQVSLGYEYGFAKVFDDSDLKGHNGNFMVGVSYMF